MQIIFKGHAFNSDEPIILGKDLKFMRLSNDITTFVAADMIGVKSRKTIENWESGRSQPSIGKFIELCHHYKYNPSLVIDACMDRAMATKISEEVPAIDMKACRI